MKLQRLWLVSVLAGALTVFGCGSSDDGNGGGAGTGGGTGGGAGTGGSAGTGGTAGSAGMPGTGGSGGTAGAGGGVSSITPGLYSAQPRGTLVCLFVNEDGTGLVADPSCRTNKAFYLLDTGEAMVQDECLITYPDEGDAEQEVPIVDGRFEIEATRTDAIGEYTISVSGEFSENGGVNGVGTHSRDCPDERTWSAGAGCCSQCEWCQ
jgi:hypothetical protein